MLGFLGERDLRYTRYFPFTVVKTNKKRCQTNIKPNILYNAKHVACSWWMIIIRMIRLCFFFPEEGLLFGIHLLWDVVWGMWIFLLLEERFDSFSRLLVDINYSQKILIMKRMDSLTMLQFQTRMANPDYEGYRCLPFFTVSRFGLGLQFKKRRTGLAQETNLRRKSWSENSVLGESNDLTLHKLLFGPCFPAI